MGRVLRVLMAVARELITFPGFPNSKGKIQENSSNAIRSVFLRLKRWLSSPSRQKQPAFLAVIEIRLARGLRIRGLHPESTVSK